MTNRFLAALGAAAALTAFVACPALAQSSVKVGTLTCDVSAGIGMLISQQQTMTCTFAPASGGPPDNYIGRIEKFGLALGAVQQGTMVWGVLAPATGFPMERWREPTGASAPRRPLGRGWAPTSWSVEPAAHFLYSPYPSKVRPGSISLPESRP